MPIFTSVNFDRYRDIPLCFIPGGAGNIVCNWNKINVLHENSKPSKSERKVIYQRERERERERGIAGFFLSNRMEWDPPTCSECRDVTRI